MGGKRGKPAASVDGAAQGGPSRKRQTRGLSVQGAGSVGLSEDTLQRVLPLLLERLEPEGAARLFQVCSLWVWVWDSLVVGFGFRV